MACLWKQHLSYCRNPPYTAVRLVFTTFIALMFGTIFWDIGSKRYEEIWLQIAHSKSKLAHLSVILVKFCATVEQSNKISLMQWAQCMRLFSSLGYKMQHQYSQLWELREQSFTEKEQPECIQLYHMPLDRYYILSWFVKFSKVL